MKSEIFFNKHEFPNLLQFFFQKLLKKPMPPSLEGMQNTITLSIYKNEAVCDIWRDSRYYIYIRVSPQWLQENLEGVALAEFAVLRMKGGEKA